jgi:hypothetical protein
MIRWFITSFIATMLLNACWPWLGKIGVGRLPGDLRFRAFGREYAFPFMSSIVITAIGLALVRVL